MSRFKHSQLHFIFEKVFKFLVKLEKQCVKALQINLTSL